MIRNFQASGVGNLPLGVIGVIANFLATLQNAFDELIHCEKEVKKQIAFLTSRVDSRNRNFPNRELGFEIERAEGVIKVNPIRMSNENGKFTPNINKNTIGVIHDHPNGNENLSEADISYAKNNKLVVYAFAFDRGLTRIKLINGNNPTNEKGKDRVLDPADCPKKKKN